MYPVAFITIIRIENCLSMQTYSLTRIKSIHWLNFFIEDQPSNCAFLGDRIDFTGKEKRPCLTCLVCLVVDFINLINCFSVIYINSTIRQSKYKQDTTRQSSTILRQIEFWYDPRQPFVLFGPVFVLQDKLLSCCFQSPTLIKCLFLCLLQIFFPQQDKQDIQDRQNTPSL